MKKVIWGCLILGCGSLSIGCTASKNSVKRKYNKVWKQMVKSEAWSNTLVAESTAKIDGRSDLYTNILDAAILKEVEYVFPVDEGQGFDQKYDKLVSRAYFKIIAEAENADERLRGEYELWKARRLESDQTTNPEMHRQYALVTKRYRAHQKMLKGLKSWNILSEYGTDDLAFFKEENRNEVRQMLLGNKDEKAIVGFLIYKLADLYHFEQQSIR